MLVSCASRRAQRQLTSTAARKFARGTCPRARYTLRVRFTRGERDLFTSALDGKATAVFAWSCGSGGSGPSAGQGGSRQLANNAFSGRSGGRAGASGRKGNGRNADGDGRIGVVGRALINEAERFLLFTGTVCPYFTTPANAGLPQPVKMSTSHLGSPVAGHRTPVAKGSRRSVCHRSAPSLGSISREQWHTTS
ncbi:unnamed protein product [Lampetra fluviatilis]